MKIGNFFMLLIPLFLVTFAVFAYFVVKWQPDRRWAEFRKKKFNERYENAELGKTFEAKLMEDVSTKYRRKQPSFSSEMVEQRIKELEPIWEQQRAELRNDAHPSEDMKNEMNEE